MAEIFMINVQKVLVSRNVKGRVVSEKLRGDLIIGIRKWEKSDSDMAVVGRDTPMTCVTMINPVTGAELYIRIQEDSEAFSARFINEQPRRAK